MASTVTLILYIFLFITPLIQAERNHPLLSDFDALGTWFDGVAAINHTNNETPASKNTSIAIVGAGISGLTTALLLDSVGIHNWEIIEASNRVGGRIRTKYLGGTEEWAEMGPMRIPHRVRYEDGEVVEFSDHKMVFEVAEMLNEMNGVDGEWRVDFIPFVEHSENELRGGRDTKRHTDGRIPTRKEVKTDPSLLESRPKSEEYERTEAAMGEIQRNKTTMKHIQKDVHRAHRAAMDEGLDDWDQQGMMHHVFNASANITDEILTANFQSSIWDTMYLYAQFGLGDTKDELSIEWKCVDGGFNRLADAFLPHIRDRLTLNRKIRKLEALQEGNRVKTKLSWYPSVTNRTAQSKEYDYTIMAVPFTMTRFMDLPKFSSALDRATSAGGLRFGPACKVALLFSERFWEKGERPIFGGYSETVDPAVAALHYPVYGWNQSRPGIIFSYQDELYGDILVSLSDEEHVQTVLDSAVDLHGEQARDLYTGHYERLCWLQDEHTATAWCHPDVGQHKLYIPAFHRTEYNTIFIGEHTAVTHDWLSSGILSAVRGSIQLLLELGLVDEAKELNRRWMGRWIKHEERK
ncbi:hypothetical protein ASPWEDRAFT_121674 [Aspergillus wentii DTO 134E9]|uniref:Amine oxidase domain-containing protein n=1 Tax=Aspergillus wentii DTO 134E9 TaxID=1073089 RepID=A0A1L9R4Z3_ASPWE|nr:uncharacterized protein ASPWEDRAFT_121674 [Aspergillus wentii DTO 134E9]OJJ29962.1 hypothetical protein ASPWEDRAFT_121674 [Aspergillus wentii DTO 134E9]